MLAAGSCVKIILLLVVLFGEILETIREEVSLRGIPFKV